MKPILVSLIVGLAGVFSGLNMMMSGWNFWWSTALQILGVILLIVAGMKFNNLIGERIFAARGLDYARDHEPTGEARTFLPLAAICVAAVYGVCWFVYSTAK